MLEQGLFGRGGTYRAVIMDKSNKRLTARQSRVLQVLVGGGGVSDAAKATGASRQAIYNWQLLPQFQDALRQAERESVEMLSRSLVSLGLLARQALRDALEDKQTPAAVKIRASDIVLGRLLQLLEMVEFEARLSELEREVLRNGNTR
jgi:transposase-like protein